MKKIFLTSAVALALLSGCNNDYDGQAVPGSKLVVAASIDYVNTRVSDTGTEWTVNDAIGVSDNLSVNPNQNIKYVTNSTTGVFTSATDIYILGSEPVTFTAYYPYSGSEGTPAGEVNFSIVNGSGEYVGSSAIDFMFAEEATASREIPQVNFKFKHMMSKLKLNFKGDAVIDTRADTPISYTLRGVTTDGTFNTADGIITRGTTKGDVTMQATLGSASSVILPPAASPEGTAETIQLIITMGDKVYSGTFTPALAASQEYRYEIELNQTEGGTTLQISSPTIDGWTPNESGSIDIEEDTNLNPTLEIGDFLCLDGTTIDKDKTLDEKMKAEIIGVVYYVGKATEDVALMRDFPDCTHGLAVALNNANTEPEAFASGKDGIVNSWLESQSFKEDYLGTWVGTNPVPSSGTIQGYNNTKVFELSSLDETAVGEGMTSWKEQSDNMIAALTKFRTEHPVEFAEWYLPSWKELDIIRENYDIVSASVVKVGGTLEKNDGFETSPDWFYWASLERNATNVWGSPLASVTSNQYLARNSKKGYFRFAIAF